MEATILQKAMLDHVTELLLPFNHLSSVPPSVQSVMDGYNRQLRHEGLKIKATHYYDGIGRGWIIQFDKA